MAGTSVWGLLQLVAACQRVGGEQPVGDEGHLPLKPSQSRPFVVALSLTSTLNTTYRLRV